MSPRSMQARIRVLDIPDPYGGDLELYRRTRDALDCAAERLADELCQPVDPA